MEKTTIPNLAENETGYVDANGNRVAVRLSRRSDGSEQVVAFEVQGRCVDDKGATLAVDGTPAVAPAHAWSLNLDAIVNGKTTLEAHVEAARVEQAERAVRHRAAMEAYLSLPA